MKKRVLIRHLNKHHCYATGRQKGSHAQFRNEETGEWTMVPIHDDISEYLAYDICKQLGIPRVGNN